MTPQRMATVVVMLIGIVLASLVTIVMPAPEAYAGDCTIRYSRQFCGAVKNRTGRAIHITTKLKAKPNRFTPHRCDVWNWKGGSGRSWYQAACDQEIRGNGVFGGHGTGYDVDAFTFANHGYHVRHWRYGTWHWEIKGVWTKIQDREFADCGIGDNNAVWCTVLLQVGPGLLR